MNTQYFTENGNQKFPLTTQALEFMQQQIKLAYQLTTIVGSNVILRQSSTNTNGLIIFRGELMPLTGTPATIISVVENTEQLIVEGKYAGNIRTTRNATYSNSPLSGNYQPVQNFTNINNLTTLTQQIDALQQHQVPRSTIIDWYGNCTAATVPQNYVPCGMFGNQLTTEQQLQDEMQAWRERCGSSLNIQRTGTNNKYLRITNVNGITVPDLTDRFIVQAGHDYNLADTGGQNQHTLTIPELPAHSHTLNIFNDDFSGAGGTEAGPGLLGTDSPTRQTIATYQDQPIINTTGQNQSHENRPPYYALYKLIKVI